MTEQIATQASRFEEALQELEAIVDRLEQETPSLDEAVASYKKGTELARYCLQRLDEAELEIEELKLQDDGE